MRRILRGSILSRKDFPGPSSLPTKMRGFSAKPQDLPGVDIVVVDDRLYDGWDTVIIALFGATLDTDEDDTDKDKDGFKKIRSINNGTTLYGSNDASTLLNSLGKQDAFTERHFDSPIHCDGNGRPWLLVLDLMLFSGDVAEEREWLGELLKIARSISSQSARLAWPGFSKDELDSVENWLSSGNTDDPAYLTALSLLPRLCALRWPAVPILLFSGTSRRELLDKLHGYRNIFPAPKKPNLLSGAVTEEVEAFLAGWRREIEATKGLIEVQKKLLLLQDDIEPASESGDGGCMGGSRRNSDPSHCIIDSRMQ